MMDLIHEVRRTECFVQLGVFPANIEIKGYLLSMPNFEIFKGGPEEEGKVSTKKPKAGYSPASTALLLATAVLTSAGRAIIMISNAAFPVFRTPYTEYMRTEYRVLCANYVQRS